MSYDYGNVPDYTYGNPLVDELAGTPPPKARLLVSALKGKPRTQSSSIAPTTAIESIQPKQPIDPLQARIDALGKEREGLLKDQDAAYAKPDYAGYGEYAQQRRDTGSRALVMALAAQQADMAPFQAHYLKQAAEARAPMKVTGGTITDQGFVEDVGHTQELNARRIDARLKQLDAIVQNTTNLQVQQQARQEAAQLRREMAESQQATARMIAAQSSADRRYAADLAHTDRVAAREAAAGQLKGPEQKMSLEINAQKGAVSQAIEAANAAPDAFGFKVGSPDMLPGTVGSMAMSARDRMLTPEQRTARFAVYNNVSKIINERAGAAQSVQELKRLRSFLPNETDSHEVVIDKLNQFNAYLDAQHATLPHANSPGAAPASAAPAAGQKPLTVEQRAQGYY